MSTVFRPFDNNLLEEWTDWLNGVTKRFGAVGYGNASKCISVDRIRSAITSTDLLLSIALEDQGCERGIIVITHARWEESVIHKPVAKVVFFAADSFSTAHKIAREAIRKSAEHGIVLLSATPGQSPTFIHVALTEAGFHVGSQSMTVQADLQRIAPAVARIPLRGKFRPARHEDADAVAEIARTGFANARFTSDPFFPSEWGGKLYATWARNLVLGAADAVVVAEQRDRIVGFVSMCMDEDRRRRVPDLMAVDVKLDGLGIGVMLVRHMLDWYRERGLKLMVGGTEKNNTAINALYARLGFLFLDVNICYHASPALSPLRERLATTM